MNSIFTHKYDQNENEVSQNIHKKLSEIHLLSLGFIQDFLFLQKHLKFIS